MPSLNECNFIGHLGRDVECRNFQNGSRVANLRIACTETWRDKQSGDKKERTEWVSIAVFAEPLIKYAEKYLQKGSKVYIKGKLQTRKYQAQDGTDRYSTEVVLHPYEGKLIGLDKREDGQSGGGYDSGNGGSGYGAGGRPGGGSRDLEDEIPFAFNRLA